MAKIEQTIVLNFQTQLQQAKSDILELAKLSQQAKIAPGQTGALSSPERFGVEQAISEQAVQSGLSPDALKAVLEDVNKILEQEVSIKTRVDELSVKRLETEKKIKTQEQEKNTLISEGAQLLGLRADTSLQEVTAAKRKLDIEVSSGNATKEQLEQHKQVSDVFDKLSTKNRSLGQLIRSNGKFTQDITDGVKEQDDTFVKLRTTLNALKLTTEQRENLEAKLTPIIMLQTQQVRELEKAQQKSVKAAKANAKAQDDINTSLRNTPKTFAEKATGAFLYFQAVQAIRRVARAAVTTLVELDKALTDIAIVTTMTREETQELIGTYQNMAKEVGLTTTEVVQLSTAFFRQGREAADALELTKTAAIFARIAAINVNDAANFLTAAINGFNLAASESTRIIDRFAALGANAAASAQEIAIALSKVAPAAASAGVGIDNLMAFVTKAIETTREAPENIGTAFKTIFARMRQLTDIGKVDEDGTDVNNVEKALRNIGVQLRDSQGEFRDLDKVLIDVGKRWPDITRSQQAYVATTLAGTRQQTRLIALFENFDRTLELIGTSQRSAGAAAIQHAKFMEGLEAATTNLKTSFQEFITSIANSNQLLFLIDGLRTGVDLLNTAFGKLILTGAVYKLGVMATANKEGRFFKAITGVKTGLLNMLQPFGFVTKAKSALIVKTDMLSNFLAKNAAQNLSVGLSGIKVAKTESLLTKVRAKSLLALTDQTRRGIQSTANLHGMSKAQVKAIFILKKHTSILSKNAFVGIKKIAVDKKMSVTQVLVGKTAIFAGKAVAKASLTMMKAMAKLLLSPMALVIALGGIVLALKKMADATDTTNPMVAEFQIRIKKAAKVLQDMVQKIKDFFKNLVDGTGILSIFFRMFLNGWKLVFKILGNLPFVGDLFKAFTEDLTATERAAAGIVVLTNKIKDLNTEMRKLESQSQKLSTVLRKFNKLNNQRFRTDLENTQLTELESQLQGIIGSTSVGFQLVIETNDFLSDNQTQIDRITQKVRDAIQLEFEKNPAISFEQLINSDKLTDEMKENIPLLLQTFGEILIEGFEDLEPAAQAALSRLFKLHPDALSDVSATVSEAAESFVLKKTGTNVVTSDGLIEMASAEVNVDFAAGIGFEEAFEKFVAQGFEGTIEDFADLTEGKFQIKPITIDDSPLLALTASTAAFLDTFSDIQNADDFVLFLSNLGDVDLSNLSAEDLEAYNLALQSAGLADFSRLMGLDESAQKQLFTKGGTAFVRAFSAGIGEEVNKLDFEDEKLFFTNPDTGERDFTVLRPASQVASDFTDDLMSHILERGTVEDLGTTLNTLFKEGFQGVTAEDFRKLKLFDILVPEVNMDSVQKIIEELMDETEKIISLASKSLNELTSEELTFLRTKQPEVLNDMGRGTFDAEAFRNDAQQEAIATIEEAAALTEQEFQNNKDRLTTILGLKRDATHEEIQAALNLSEIQELLNEEENEQLVNNYNAALSVMQVNLTTLDILRAQAMLNKQNTDAIKARYKVQLDLLKSQSAAIKDAEKIRNLQEQSADVARRSMDATRIGAVGSMEAKFNQQQINQEVAKMNRALQDQMQTAQLEAQQKILEDSQQKAIEAATNKLTEATINSADASNRAADSSNRVADALVVNPLTPTSTPTPFNSSTNLDRAVLEIPGYGPYSR